MGYLLIKVNFGEDFGEIFFCSIQTGHLTYLGSNAL